MSFYTSLSGLQASQTEMNTISHNLANVATNGFKKSRTDFADVIASSVSLSPTLMTGSGTVVKGNIQQFGQGNLIQSSSSLDLAISGDGFFAVKPQLDGAKVDFTRNGSFSVNQDHFVTDAQGNYLQVYPVDGSGAVVATGIDQTKALQLPQTSGIAKPTSLVNMTANLPSPGSIPVTATFDRFAPPSYTRSTSTPPPRSSPSRAASRRVRRTGRRSASSRASPSATTAWSRRASRTVTSRRWARSCWPSSPTPPAFASSAIRPGRRPACRASRSLARPVWTASAICCRRRSNRRTSTSPRNWSSRSRRSG